MEATRSRGESKKSYLFLGEVGDVAGHGSGDDEAARALFLEHFTDSLCAVEDTSQVSVDDVLPGLDGALENTRISSRSSVGDEAVDTAELSNDIIDELLDAVEVVDLALVGLALDAVLLGYCLCVLLATFGTAGIGEGNVGTHFCASSHGFDAHAFGTGGTGDDDNLSFKAEHVEETSGCQYLLGSFGGDQEVRLS